MEFIPKNRILEHRVDTLMSVRKEYNLDKPGMMENAVRLLREWVEKQQHFKKKDFPDHYLETAIIACKGSIERAKIKMDRLCTFRTLLPQFFGVYNVKTDFGILFDAMNPIVLPKLTPDLYRVIIVRGNRKVKLIKDFLDYYIYANLIAEYTRRYDYCHGYYIVGDFSGVEIMDFLPNLNLVQIRQIISILIEGYGLRVKRIHLFTPSKLIDSFIALLKQVLSQKLSDRIHIHTSLDELPNLLPIEIFPVEYGGKERPCMTVFEEWAQVLSSEEFLNHLRDMHESGTDESCRQVDKFNEQYAGMPGTFRTLSID